MRMSAEIRSWWWLYLLMLFIVSAGFSCGLLLPEASPPDAAAASRAYIGDYMLLLPGVELDCMAEFWRALKSDLPLLAAVLIAGWSAWSLPLLIGALFMRGLMLGVAMGFLFEYQYLGGALLIVLAILPQNLLLLLLLLRAGRQAICAALPAGVGGLCAARTAARRNYGRFSLVMLGGVLLSAVLQGWISPLLLKLFHII